ncbi:NmrA family NAD(P)-binding protein [Mucilaginibacter sp. 21P]|uniref:NmrA family NAD(P)-binding protein n=1 Tax=Mucilaginibacter sp. 21P TaxID=2778902 RepID=UPI001C58EA5D|nr:NmrA family NAD(P)-binding protein [Mucilaginibacter sp. 21P]QXV63835.1 NmrA family NAD(P)-binding protein [Mucilaginibacter sp. 21P]
MAFFCINLMEFYTPKMDRDRLVVPTYLPEDFRASFVDPLTATGPAVLQILSDPKLYAGQSLPVTGDIISPKEMVETFNRVTRNKAEYRSA